MQKQKRNGNWPKVFLGGLPSNLTETDLRNFFSRFGAVMEVVIMFDQEKKKSRGKCLLAVWTSNKSLRLAQLAKGLTTVSVTVLVVGHLVKHPVNCWKSLSSCYRLWEKIVWGETSAIFSIWIGFTTVVTILFFYNQSLFVRWAIVLLYIRYCKL